MVVGVADISVTSDKLRAGMCSDSSIACSNARGFGASTIQSRSDVNSG